MLNPALDIAACRDELESTGRTRVRNVFRVEAARALQQCLAQEIPWRLAVRSGGQSRTLTVDEVGDRETTLVSEAHAHAGDDFGFVYDSYMLIRAYLEQWDPQLQIHRLTEYLNSPEFLAFARNLADYPLIAKVDAQATRYRRGHFLSMHDDREDSEGRYCAYVLGLSEGWDRSWGGLLEFYDQHDVQQASFVPEFNTLSVFRVPVSHQVTEVMPAAEGDRLSITGWFRER